MHITDATGQGPGAKVGSTNRLYTFSVSESFEEFANKQGDAYNINTGPITLTNATDTPILYLKNNEDKDLIVQAIAVGNGASTGGSGEAAITIVRNPTAGTTISNANAVDMNGNRNFGSTKSLSADAYKGATGETMTDGDDLILFYATAPSRLFGTVNLIIPKAQAVGIKYQAPTGNTSISVYAALVCHLDEAL